MLVGKHVSHRARPLLALLASLPASFPAPSGDWLPVSPTACLGLLSCWPPRRCLVDPPWRALAPPAGPDIQGFLGRLEGEDRSQ